jgi:hypothetical protein
MQVLRILALRDQAKEAGGMSAVNQITSPGDIRVTR